MSNAETRALWESELKYKALENGRTAFVLGRYRTDRTAPTSATDVVNGDLEGDYLYDATYQYTLVNAGGAIRWDRRTLNVSW